MNTVQQLDKFHKTKAGYLLFGVIELVLAYVTASWAIDSGRILAYTFTLILLIGGIHNFFKLILSYFRKGKIGV